MLLSWHGMYSERHLYQMDCLGFESRRSLFSPLTLYVRMLASEAGQMSTQDPIKLFLYPLKCEDSEKISAEVQDVFGLCFREMNRVSRGLSSGRKAATDKAPVEELQKLIEYPDPRIWYPQRGMT